MDATLNILDSVFEHLIQTELVIKQKPNSKNIVEFAQILNSIAPIIAAEERLSAWIRYYTMNYPEQFTEFTERTGQSGEILLGSCQYITDRLCLTGRININWDKRNSKFCVFDAKRAEESGRDEHSRPINKQMHAVALAKDNLAKLTATGKTPRPFVQRGADEHLRGYSGRGRGRGRPHYGRNSEYNQPRPLRPYSLSDKKIQQIKESVLGASELPVKPKTRKVKAVSKSVKKTMNPSSDEDAPNTSDNEVGVDESPDVSENDAAGSDEEVSNSSESNSADEESAEENTDESENDDVDGSTEESTEESAPVKKKPAAKKAVKKTSVVKKITAKKTVAVGKKTSAVGKKTATGKKTILTTRRIKSTALEQLDDGADAISITKALHDSGEIGWGSEGSE